MFVSVIPERAKGASPESKIATIRHKLSGTLLHQPWLWIPDSRFVASANDMTPVYYRPCPPHKKFRKTRQSREPVPLKKLNNLKKPSVCYKLKCFLDPSRTKAATRWTEGTGRCGSRGFL